MDIMSKRTKVVPDELLSKEFLSQFKTEENVSRFLKESNSFVCGYNCQTVLLKGFVVDKEKDAYLLDEIESDKTEVMLPHAGNVPLDGFENNYCRRAC